ncbi:hypothetical protein D3C86_1212420 [compost metagenome]
MPRMIAMSPPRAGRKNAVLVGLSPLVSISIACCGCWKRSRPRSLSGLMHTTCAPRFTASRSGSSMRGWLVPGFWPQTKIASACSKSSKVTVPLPTPTLCDNATPLASWHMFEQSGKLLVP